MQAVATGQYPLAAGQSPAEPPAFDREAIGRLARSPRRVRPTGGTTSRSCAQAVEIVHKNPAGNLDEAVRNVAGFRNVTCRRGSASLPTAPTPGRLPRRMLPCTLQRATDDNWTAHNSVPPQGRMTY